MNAQVWIWERKRNLQVVAFAAPLQHGAQRFFKIKLGCKDHLVAALYRDSTYGHCRFCESFSIVHDRDSDLFAFEYLLVELLLKPFICQINAQLLKTVLFEALKPINIQDAYWMVARLSFACREDNLYILSPNLSNVKWLCGWVKLHIENGNGPWEAVNLKVQELGVWSAGKESKVVHVLYGTIQEPSKAYHILVLIVLVRSSCKTFCSCE